MERYRERNRKRKTIANFGKPLPTVRLGLQPGRDMVPCLREMVGIGDMGQGQKQGRGRLQGAGVIH